MLNTMFRSIFFSTLAYTLLSACNNAAKKEETGKIINIPGLDNCDSAAVMYYHTPGNPRFFSMSKLYDKEILSAIADNINAPIIEPKDTCSTQGKINYYGKEDAVYVVYFSRVKDCMTLSFIKTGEKYFVPMSDRTKDLLEELEKEAKEPVAMVP